LSTQKKPKILVVDDQPINVKLLQSKLERQSMDVSIAFDGRECLEKVVSVHPDIILLDIMMPEMDGIETCRLIKADPKTKAIHIIFITANVTKKQKIQGLEAGAVDYITKPIDLEETLARVHTQLRLQSIYRENIVLQTRLGDARKTAAVGSITQGIAHNLNNLLGVVVGYLDLIKNSSKNPDMIERCLGSMDHAVSRMVEIIRQLSSIASNETFEMEAISIKTLTESSIARFSQEHQCEANITVCTDIKSDVQITTNAEIFEVILCKLLSNAYESYQENLNDTKRIIQLDIAQQRDRSKSNIKITVSDNGNGIDPEITEKIFEPFVTTKTAVGRGMGLTIARHTIRNLGGDVHLIENKSGGVSAILTHPI
jgi:two-component system sensor histidine kinase/response regulator